ncbi:unnamed protein product [Closterium sp. NIES-64]|nr:unnamed protein product [Closterium sp. NIES-64]
MDWRTFRAKLVAGHEATRSVSAPSPAQEAVGLEIWQVRNSGAGVVLFRGLSKWFEIWQDRMSLENWALLASQNPRLAKEVPWVHSTGGAEAGGVLLAAPFSQLPGQGGAEGGDGGRGGGAGALDRRLWQAAVFLVEHGGASGASWGLLLNRPSGIRFRWVEDAALVAFSHLLALAKVNRVEEASLAVFARNAIYIGGFKSDGSTLYFLHGHDLPGLRSQPDLPCVHALEAPFSTPLLLSGMLLFLHGHSLLLASEVVPRVYKGGLELEAEQVLLEGPSLLSPSACLTSFSSSCPLPRQLMPGVYMGGLEAAAEQVLLGNMPPSDFRFFVGQVEWPAGKLQEEVDAGLWYTAACARSLVLKQCLQLPKPLW